MIVWGGADGAWPWDGVTAFGDGMRLDPETGVWRSMSSENAPSARANHVAVWTGSEMIVWGARGLSDGAAYDPATDSWRTISDSPCRARYEAGVWTGTEMIVWGKRDLSCYPEASYGSRYDPSSDTWSWLPSIPDSYDPDEHSAVWTGSELIFWGGLLNREHLSNEGERVDLVGLSATPIEHYWGDERSRHTAVWTGSQMIVWGGITEETFGVVEACGEGAGYDLETGTWQPISTVGSPRARSEHSAVWTGSEMIVWGGTDGAALLDDGAVFVP